MILINDLKAHNSFLHSEFIQAFSRVISSGWYVLGNEVSAFEEEFAAYCGMPAGVGVASGSDALELALLALDVGRGDKVALVANAGGYASLAVSAVGASPVYIDIESSSMNLDPDDLQHVLSSDIKAIIVTHLYGRMVDMPRVLRLTALHSIPVIEDCAQAHGASLQGRMAGSWGELSCFSFYPTKNLGGLGDGGMILCRDENLLGRLRQLRQYGWQGKYRVSISGGRNSRLDELQAAILRVKLPYLNAWNELRRMVALQYEGMLVNQGFVLPVIDEGFVAHLYVVRSLSRDRLLQEMVAQGVRVEIHYPLPDHQQPLLSLGWRSRTLPQTEKACSEILTLPCYPEMSEAEIQHVVDMLCEIQVRLEI